MSQKEPTPEELRNAYKAAEAGAGQSKEAEDLFKSMAQYMREGEVLEEAYDRMPDSLKARLGDFLTLESLDPSSGS